MEVSKTTRQSNFELLRIILIGMVLVIHFQNVFIINYDEIEVRYKFLFELLRAFCICAVDCFIILSGYFLCENNKIQIRKIINLFVTVIVSFVIGIIIDNILRLFIKLINILLDKITIFNLTFTI